MADQEALSKENFLVMAEASGLDVSSPHMDDLYAYVKVLLTSLKPMQELDLSGVEPATILTLSKE